MLSRKIFRKAQTVTLAVTLVLRSSVQLLLTLAALFPLSDSEDLIEEAHKARALGVGEELAGGLILFDYAI